MRACIAILCIILCNSEAAKILLMPTNFRSYVKFFTLMAQTLKEDGHEPSILITESNIPLAESAGIKFISFGSDVNSFAARENQTMTISTTVSPFLVWYLTADKTRGFCDQVLSQTWLMEDLEKEHFDLAIMDGFSVLRCMYVIPYRLNLRYITVNAWDDAWEAKVPVLPSIVGKQSAVVLDKNSGLMARSYNAFQSLLAHALLPPGLVADDTLISKFAPNRPPTTFQKLIEASEMWMINMETVCLDFPRPHGLHYQYIACLGCEGASPLQGKVAEFADGATDGLVVVSFGSTAKNLPDDIFDSLMNAFAKFKFRFIMRSKKVAETPRNVLILPWLPQNDLLGHKNTKLFITHGGNNGQLEALFHGVPMIIVPFFADQFYNGQRVVSHQYGVMLDTGSLREEDIYYAIEEVTDNEVYSDNIKRCSRIFHSLPKPQDTFLFWVNHVLEFGGEHLKPLHIDFPLWKMFMLDIFAFVGLCMISFVLVCYCLVSKCRGVRTRPKSKIE